MARNDAAKRAANAALQPEDVWAEKDRWLPVVLQAKEKLTCRGVEKPAGLSGGNLVLHTYMLVSGFVKWIVRYEVGKQYIVIGGFITEYLPNDDRPRRPMKPLKTHGKTVIINDKKGGNELAREARVLIDGDGLPVPVPVEVWNAQFA
jgi:hypothetical protein